MAVTIIQKPSKKFRIRCIFCDALLEYEMQDTDGRYIQCPCCQNWNNHQLHIIPKESEDTE